MVVVLRKKSVLEFSIGSYPSSTFPLTRQCLYRRGPGVLEPRDTDKGVTGLP